MGILILLLETQTDYAVVDPQADLSPFTAIVLSGAPGLIDTPIYGEGEASEAFKENLQKGVLFPKRLGYQDELASMVVVPGSRTPTVCSESATPKE